MLVVNLSNLSGGAAAIPALAPDIYACSIASSSTLDVVEVDGRSLGVGGVVPCRPGSTVTCAARGRLSDNQSAFPSIRVTPPGSFLQVEQLSDNVDLILWQRGDCGVVAPPARRANATYTAFVPASAVSTFPVVFAPGVGARALRVPCPGRQIAYVWLWESQVDPDAALSMLIRTRRQATGNAAASVGGVRHANNELVIAYGNDNSNVTAGDSYRAPEAVDLRGASEIEILLGGKVSGVVTQGWYVSVELVDPN